MKNVIITGATGMIGRIILERCLQSNKVAKVTSISRRKSGIENSKLIEVLHDDYLDYSNVKEHFSDQDVCFFCIGVYTGQVPKDEFRKITIDYTKTFAETLKTCNNKDLSFCFLSGQGADSSEKSNIMFARDKGIAENILLNLQFNKTYLFRPGYIYPVTPRKEPNFGYKVFRLLYKPVSKIYPNIGVTSEKLANSMFEVGINGNEKTIFENVDIRLYKP